MHVCITFPIFQSNYSETLPSCVSRPGSSEERGCTSHCIATFEQTPNFFCEIRTPCLCAHYKVIVAMLVTTISQSAPVTLSSRSGSTFDEAGENGHQRRTAIWRSPTNSVSSNMSSSVGVMDSLSLSPNRYIMKTLCLSKRNQGLPGKSEYAKLLSCGLGTYIYEMIVSSVHT